MANDDETGERSIAGVDPKRAPTNTLWKGRGRFDAAGAGGAGGVVARYESLDSPPDFYLFEPTFASKTAMTHVEPRLEASRVGPSRCFRLIRSRATTAAPDVLSAVFLPPGQKRGDRFRRSSTSMPARRMSNAAQEWGGGAPNSIPVQVFATRGYAVLLVDVPLGPAGQGRQSDPGDG